MSELPQRVLIDDQPKWNPWKHDVLGYASFAARLAKLIITLQAPNGFVFGIHGQWGSGKSTAINFILTYLRKHNQEHENDQITLIDFRPWIVSAHQDLIAAFLKVLSENIDPEQIRRERARNRIARLVSGSTDGVVDAIATLAAATTPMLGPTTGIASAFAKKSVSAMVDSFIDDPSLQAAYQKLWDAMKSSRKRILVTIDDIDRLEKEDVRSIMRMVKSIGKLPNVVYLLSYDREIVWRILDGKNQRNGPRFAEKIIQQELELPVPKKGALLRQLDLEIGFVYADTLQSSRWFYIIRDGLERWIRVPRDVVRLSNAVKFSWPALENEIDPQDLLAMEGLRLFDNKAFNWVRDNRDVVFGSGRFVLGGEEFKKSIMAELKDSLAEPVQALVAVLFPQLSKDLSTSSLSEPYVDIMKRRGIASEAGYDAYFSLHPSSDQISRSLIQEITNSDDKADVELFIREVVGTKNSRDESMIAKLLDELRAHYTGSPPAEPNRVLLGALFNVGETIIGLDEWSGPFQIPPRSQLALLVRNLLEREPESERMNALVEAFTNSDSPAFLADVYVNLGRDLGIFPSASSQTPLITKDDFRDLGKLLLPKIEAHEVNGTLADAPHYFDIVRAWGHLGPHSRPKDWLTSGLNSSAVFTARAADGLASKTISPKPSAYHFTERPNGSFYDLPSLVDAAEKYKDNPELTLDQAALLREIARGGWEMLNKSSEATTE